MRYGALTARKLDCWNLRGTKTSLKPRLLACSRMEGFRLQLKGEQVVVCPQHDQLAVRWNACPSRNRWRGHATGTAATTQQCTMAPLELDWVLYSVKIWLNDHRAFQYQGCPGVDLEKAEASIETRYHSIQLLSRCPTYQLNRWIAIGVRHETGV